MTYTYDRRSSTKLIWQDAADAAEDLLKALKSASVLTSDYSDLISDVKSLAGQANRKRIGKDAPNREAEIACYKRYEKVQEEIDAEMTRQVDEYIKKHDTDNWDGD